MLRFTAKLTKNKLFCMQNYSFDVYCLKESLQSPCDVLPNGSLILHHHCLLFMPLG